MKKSLNSFVNTVKQKTRKGILVGTLSAALTSSLQACREGTAEQNITAIEANKELVVMYKKYCARTVFKQPESVSYDGITYKVGDRYIETKEKRRPQEKEIVIEGDGNTFYISDGGYTIYYIDAAGQRKSLPIENAGETLTKLNHILEQSMSEQ